MPWKYDAHGNVEIASPAKEVRRFGGLDYVLEEAIVCDFALVRAWKGDRHGNLVFNKSTRNFNPLAAMAGRITIAEVEELVEPGAWTPTRSTPPASSCTACSPSPASRPPTSGSRRAPCATPSPSTPRPVP